MRTWKFFRYLLIGLVLILTPFTPGGTGQAQGSFADPSFERTWERTDRPVAERRTQQSWYWGEVPRDALHEQYDNSPRGARLVQYFDKSRMEINNPGGNPADPFYVTNGLLAVELLTGELQFSDTDFEALCPAEIPLASDVDDPVGPTYATFGRLMTGVPDARGRYATLLVTRGGSVTDLGGGMVQRTTELVQYIPETEHNIPRVFWDFLNAEDVIYANGSYTTGPLNVPWFYGSGYPVTEAYWADVIIAGNPQRILIQAFQRRVLTYNPANRPPFQVEMGNVGLHYYDWRYKDGIYACLQHLPFGSPELVPNSNPPAYSSNASFTSADGTQFIVTVTGLDPNPVRRYVSEARFFLELRPGRAEPPGQYGTPRRAVLQDPLDLEIYVDIGPSRLFKPPYVLHQIVDPDWYLSGTHYYTTDYELGSTQEVATVRGITGSVNGTLTNVSNGASTGARTTTAPNTRTLRTDGLGYGYYSLLLQGVGNTARYGLTRLVALTERPPPGIR
jgi:hypothetical protein